MVLPNLLKTRAGATRLHRQSNGRGTDQQVVQNVICAWFKASLAKLFFTTWYSTLAGKLARNWSLSTVKPL